MAFGRDGSELEIEIADLQYRRLHEALINILDLANNTNSEILNNTKDENIINIVNSALKKVKEIELKLKELKIIDF